MPENLGVENNRLAPCPDAPRCVSSDARDSGHRVEPLYIAAPPAQVWNAAVQAVRTLPRVTVVEESGDYLHAEIRSALFRFVDDLELQLRPEDGLIAVRSAARLGYHDFGVNRRRVETVRERLREAGMLR